MRKFSPDGDVLDAFMCDRTSRVKIIQGPVGSGTSSACCIHVYQQAMAQSKQPDGFQRFRTHIFRETYSKIEETTLRTWLDWFPPSEFGRFYESRPYRHEIRVGSLELDVTFMAMEDIRDAKSYFKSLETSLVWFNEGQFTQFAVIREAVERVSPPRYPAVKDGGCNWGGLILDTNAPPADHWIPIMRGDVPPPDWMSDDQRQSMVKPKNWSFFMQPPGLLETFEGDKLVGYKPNPKAENLKNLPPDFYMEKVGAQPKSWIDGNIMNRSAVQIDGKPVYPGFRHDRHVAPKPLDVIPNTPVVVGLDFGRTPAAVICQNLRGTWYVQREVIGVDTNAAQFAPILKADLAQRYPGLPLLFWGDPSGGYPGQATDTTPFTIFRANGMAVRPAPGNNLDSLRKEAVSSILQRHDGLVVDPRCTTFITGMSGGYHMRRLQVSGERYGEEPDKNQYSHICEAFEYAALGGGEGRSVAMPGSAPAKAVQTRKPYNPFSYRASSARW